MPDIPSKILDLIEIFDRNIEAYHSQQYNETQLRREFIDPFFEELGWDVTNKAGNAPQYRDVIHEDAISIAGATKAPDYCFRIGGVRKFFLETKKPSINIKGDREPAYQLRRYAWSAKLPLSILTDFEEFAIYDCLTRPSHTDSASTARIMLLNYKQYPQKWHEIAAIFSKDAIWKGSFDKFAASEKGKRGTTTVDKEFLAEIESWRRILAQIIAIRNRSLSIPELNFAVQQTIDRILFLRMCEDRGIESLGQLQAIISGDRVYPRLCEIFEKADQKYNSGLFHFEDEPDREPPDKLTLNLVVDDDKLKWILGSLYYPRSPYEFSVMPPEILGNVYEQFLGKVITLTAGHHAKIEEKPEVKKAGGVYYTPSYIVDYIVKNTVGKLTGDLSAGHCEEAEGRRSNLKSLTPKQIADLKILDPACGSGSFLLGAYTYLLNYHLDWYTNNDPKTWLKKKSPPIYEVAFSRRRNGDAMSFPHVVSGNPAPGFMPGVYRLTITEKKRILLNNIFGVDIDPQAVEVTKLSLLLKVLEGENSQTLENQYRLFHERALPDLANNIKCGNSLIGPDFFENLDVIPPPQSFSRRRHGDERNLDHLRQKINPFDYHAEFPQIFSRKNTGFDAIIGNPPYRSLLLGKKQKSEDDIIVEYFERELPHGARYKMNLFGLFIERCVELLCLNGLFSFIIPNLFFTTHHFKELRKYMLSEGTFIDISDLRYKVFEKAEIGGNGIFVFSKAKKLKETRIATANSKEEFSKPKIFYENPNVFLKDPTVNLLVDPGTRLLTKKVSGINAVKLGDICTFYQGIITGDNKKFLSNSSTGEKWGKILRGRDIERYKLQFNNTYVFYEPKQLWSNTDEKMFRVSEKLISRQTSDRLVATLDTEGYLTLDSTHVIHLKNPIFSLKYLLGIYNSKLLNLLYKSRVMESGRVFAQVKIVNLKPLPIRIIDFDNSDDKRQHDKMVKFVERMLELHKKLSAARISDEKTRIQRQITATDSQIDKLTYSLYGLTDEEIKIVERS